MAVHSSFLINALSKRLIVAFLLLISLPYLVAYMAAGTGYVFAGFLLNPIDGNSYLAKMYVGWRHEWLFRLPFTSEPGTGAYLFTFYIALGAFACLTHLPLILIYHIARMGGALALVWMIERFFKQAYPQGTNRSFAYVIALMGLGMGWLAFISGHVTSDFWLAEAYPFLSAYSSPHFTLSLALILWLLLPEHIDRNPQISWSRNWSVGIAIMLGSALLASISPFGFVLVVGVLGVLFIWEYFSALPELISRLGRPSLLRFIFDNDRFTANLWQIAWIFLGGAPVAIYTYMVIQHDPVLSLWNIQNQTPTPPVWDLLLAFSPALILAVPGIFKAIRQGCRSGRLLVAWMLVAAVMIILPFGLQRRFLLGIYLPLSLLAAFGLDFLESWLGSRVRGISLVATALALPTTLLVIQVGQFGALKHDPLLYLTKGEVAAFEWINANTHPDDLILASPQTGLFIPGWTGRRVIYGHPFETVHAETEKFAVEQYFMTASSDPQHNRSFLFDRGVKWIFYGPDERVLGRIDNFAELALAYDQYDVQIYRVISK